MVYVMGDASFARDKFETYDQDYDGYLKVSDVAGMVGKTPICTRWLYEIVFWRMDSATNDGVVDVHEFVQFCVRFKKDLEIAKLDDAPTVY